MNFVTLLKQRKLNLLALWLFPAVLSTNSFYLRDVLSGKPASWWKMFLIQLLVWSLWAAFTPLIIWLGRRVRIERPRWWTGTLFHMLASVFLVLVYLVLYTVILGLVRQVGFSPDWFIGAYLSIFISVFHWDVIIYWTILGIGYAFEYYDKLREREVQAMTLQKQLVQAQLQSLKMQLQPHFLFNTLHMIGSLVRHDDKQTAIKMLASLSDLLRASLEHVGKQEIRLQEELDFLRQYLEIQQIRFKDRLQIEMTISPETLAAKVPIFILQPLVENAIQHGLDKKRTARKLKIDAAQENGFTTLRVYNDGPPLSPEWIMAQAAGVGLSNTAARLEQLYGPSATLALENQDNGVLATVLIPYNSGEEAV